MTTGNVDERPGHRISHLARQPFAPEAAASCLQVNFTPELDALKLIGACLENDGVHCVRRLGFDDALDRDRAAEALLQTRWGGALDEHVFMKRSRATRRDGTAGR